MERGKDETQAYNKGMVETNLPKLSCDGLSLETFILLMDVNVYTLCLILEKGCRLSCINNSSVLPRVLTKLIVILIKMNINNLLF